MIVLSDVIEHLDAPVVAIRNLARSLVPYGKIAVTTPNAQAARSFLRAAVGANLGAYWDHVSCFAPDHLQAIADRVGLRLESVKGFENRDGRSRSTRVKSRVLGLIGTISPGIAGSILVVLTRPEGWVANARG